MLDSFLKRLERLLRVALLHVYTRDFDPRLNKRGDKLNGFEEVLFCTLHVVSQEPGVGLEVLSGIGDEEDIHLKVPRRLRASAFRVSSESPSSRAPMTKDQE